MGNEPRDWDTYVATFRTDRERYEATRTLTERLREWRAGCHPVHDADGPTGERVDEAKGFVTMQKEREEAADALEQAETELSSLREAAQAFASRVGHHTSCPSVGRWRTEDGRPSCECGFDALATLLSPSPADPKGQAEQYREAAEFTRSQYETLHPETKGEA